MRRKPSDFNAEIDAHLALETERLREQGLSEEAARQAARRSAGLLSARRATKADPLAALRYE